MLVPSARICAESHPGFSIYKDQCQSCHGETGAGGNTDKIEDAYDKPLQGELSVHELAMLIDRTMPQQDPDLCVGDDARQVADYVFNSFYSQAAQQRLGIGQPRIELARLTVPQLRNSIADILSHFTPAPQDPPQRSGRRRGRRSRDSDSSPAIIQPIQSGPGLQAEYFQSKGMSKADNLRLKRVDRRIDFDFKEGSPAKNITADQFTIVWQGSLAINETGYYEFRIRTQNGARLYLNNDLPEQRSRLRDDSSEAGQSALIDEWVSSGEMREGTARVFLIGGRQFPFRLEFFKYLEKEASIKIEWKPPHGIWTVLDHRNLVTDRTARTFVVDTAFPADDRSLGYERGNSISQAWHSAATNAAIAAANEVVNRLPVLSKTSEGDKERVEKLKDFLAEFAGVAFRRPLTEQENNFVRDVPFETATDVESGVRRAVLLVLNSPHFLYTNLPTPGDAVNQHAIAAQLSFALWDSIPDDELIEAANRGRLSTRAEIELHARRMVDDPRTKYKLQSFFQHWLELEERDLTKDKEMFPDFDENVIVELRESLEKFIDDIVWSEQSDYRQLLLSDYLFLNDRLRKLYPSEIRLETDVNRIDDFQRVTFPADRRAGVLTHPYLLSAFAYANNSSPIHRGVFLTRNIVGRSIKPPPVAVAFKEDEFDPNLTMREKITQLTRDKACMSCHSVINPLGFALENYDAVGRWRMVENKKIVDAKSHYETTDGKTFVVENARDIAQFAVESEQAHRAFVSQLFHHLVKQNSAAYGLDTANRLRSTFENDEFNIRNLIVNIAVVAANHGLEPHQTSDRETEL